jgi:hypothetical protein
MKRQLPDSPQILHFYQFGEVEVAGSLDYLQGIKSASVV